MTIKKLAIAGAMVLILTAANVNAKTSTFIDCNDRGCREIVNKVEIRKNVKVAVKKVYNKKHKSTKLKYSKAKSIKSILSITFPETNSQLLNKAESYLGTNPTGWARLWCARFIAVIAPGAAERLKAIGGNPNWARDYARLPGARHQGQVGDLVVLSRGRGGHIGIVKAFDNRGNPIVVSGNHGRKVGIGAYSKRRVIAYVSI